MVVFRAAVACAFALALGFVGAYIVKACHCRNRVLAWMFGVVLAGGSVAASFYWDYQLDIPKLARANPTLQPPAIRDEISFSQWVAMRKVVGWRFVKVGFNRDSPAPAADLGGGLVLVAWGCELMIILVITLWMIHEAVTFPYCEACRQWTKKKVIVLPGLGGDAARPLLARGELSGLFALSSDQRQLARSFANLILSCYLCESCGETGFVTVEEQRVSFDWRGKKKETKKSLLTLAALLPEKSAHFLGRRNAPLSKTSGPRF